jgi:hypothetical protein
MGVFPRMLQSASRVTAPASKLATTAVGRAARGAWAAYNRALAARPVLTKSATAVVVLGAADLVQQQLVRVRLARDTAAADTDSTPTPTSTTSDKLDWWRTARFCIFYGGFQAPYAHWWYGMLDRRLGASTQWRTILAKVGGVGVHPSVVVTSITRVVGCMVMACLVTNMVNNININNINNINIINGVES